MLASSASLSYNKRNIKIANFRICTLSRCKPLPVCKEKIVVWILKCPKSVFYCTLRHLISLFEFWRERMSWISFNVLSLLFGLCHLLEFTLSGPHNYNNSEAAMITSTGSSFVFRSLTVSLVASTFPCVCVISSAICHER